MSEEQDPKVGAPEGEETDRLQEQEIREEEMAEQPLEPVEEPRPRDEAEGEPEEVREHPPETLRVLEAVLFASDEILTAVRLKEILPGQPDAREIRRMVEKINTELQSQRHPFEVTEIAGGYQLRTIAYYSTWVRQLFRDRSARRLSIQALECLAIIAYRQPITKADIEAVRGVVSDGAMKTLLERHLVTISGRSDKVGRPLLYSTSKEFLSYFGLRSLSDLPTIEDFETMAREKMGDLAQELEQLRVERERAAAQETPSEASPEAESPAADDGRQPTASSPADPA